jgi:hypothetical protein
MNVVRKTIALIIIIFIGIPTLVGIIWAVGITRAVVSPEFLSELPREIIDKVPNMLDEVVEEVDREYVITDKETRLWVRALASADTSPKELLEEIGVMEWMHTELSHSLEDVGKILKGEMRPRTIMLNLRPLKTALKHEKINEYLREVIDKLPPCTDEQKEEWIAAVMDADSLEDLPPCRPQDLDEAVKILRVHWIREVEDIPDEVEMFKIERGWYFKDSAADIIQLVMSLTFFLFFLPAVILAAGAFIATSSGPGILRWLGFSTLAGGILSFGLSSFTVRFLGWGIGAFPFSYSYTDVPPLAEAFIEKSSDIFLTVVDHLFSAVNVVSGVVCIVGIVLIALSYSMVREAKPGPGKKPQTTEPRPVSPTPPPAPAAPPAPQTAEETRADTEIDKEKDSPSEVSTPDSEVQKPGA